MEKRLADQRAAEEAARKAAAAEERAAKEETARVAAEEANHRNSWCCQFVFIIQMFASKYMTCVNSDFLPKRPLSRDRCRTVLGNPATVYAQVA